MPDFATFISVLTRLISFPTLTQALGLGSKPPLAKAEDEKKTADTANNNCCFMVVPNDCVIHSVFILIKD